MATEMRLVTIDPSTPHTHTVVFLHGRGDNAPKFSASLYHSRDSQNRTLFEALPSFKWVFPQAPTRKCASLPDVWPQWFDVWDVRDFAEREDLQTSGLKEVIPVIRDILASEAAKLDGRWDHVILAGISMGAATGAHVLFNLDIPTTPGRSPDQKKLGAFLGFSCRCPFSGRSLAGMRNVIGLSDVPDHDHVLRNTPVLLEHCVDDPLVLVHNGRAMLETLRGFGVQVEWREYPRGGHWFNSPAGIDDAVSFLRRLVEKEAPAGHTLQNSQDT